MAARIVTQIALAKGAVIALILTSIIFSVLIHRASSFGKVPVVAVWHIMMLMSVVAFLHYIDLKSLTGKLFAIALVSTLTIVELLMFVWLSSMS